MKPVFFPLCLLSFWAIDLQLVNAQDRLLDSIRNSTDLQTIEPGAPAPQGNPRRGPVVTSERPFKPTFLIQPLVQRKESPRGRVVEFEYEIESNLKSTRLEISTVGMKQEENGVILPDPGVVASSEALLLTPKNITLAKGGKHVARCRVTVPRNNNPFLAYGVLVKQLPDAELGGVDEGTQVGIQFLSQYLLRAEVDVIGARGDSVGRMDIESGQLVAENGSALITVFLNNPTPTAMEFQVRTELKSVDNGKRYRSKLFVPSRRNVDIPERYDARILPKTRLRMEGFLPTAVFPGEYELTVELLFKGRVLKRQTFPVTIQSGDFPAQDATIVQVAKDIGISPSSLELSLRPGGRRIQSVTIENNSQQDIVATLKAKNFVGELGDWINFRPAEIELSPGQKRKVLVTLGRKRDFSEHSYAFATVEVRPSVGEAIGEQDIPIGLLTRSESEPELKFGGLEWQPKPRGFVFPVKNEGARHAALQAQMVLRDAFGRQLTFNGGYGAWLLPGKENRLTFAMPQMPPPGDYEMTVTMSRGEGLDPVRLRQNITIQSAASLPANEERAAERISQGDKENEIRE